MKTDTSDVNAVGPGRTLPASTVFELLTSRHRRYAMYYLSRRVGTVTLNELAAQISRWEDDLSSEAIERVSTGLHHGHLPMLVDAGVVRYDPATGAVARTPSADALDPYLDLAMREDVRS